MARKDKGKQSVGDIDELDLPPEKEASKQRQMGAFIGEIALIVVAALVITSLLRVFVFQVFEVPSRSMEQTLEVKDRIVAVRLFDYHRGDIVVFEDPDARWMGVQQGSSSQFRRGLEKLYLLPDSSQGYLVKRVIGMPGDHVKCCDQDQRITINGKALDEKSYLYTDSSGIPVSPSDTPFDVVVPADHIFVMGDHRDMSGDSRLHMCAPTTGGEPAGSYGFIPSDKVVGPVKLILSPLSRIAGFSPPDSFADIPPASGEAPPAPIIAEGSCGGR